MAESLEQLLSTTLRKEIERSYPDHRVAKLSEASPIEDFTVPDNRDSDKIKEMFMVVFLLKVEKETPLKLKILKPLQFCLSLFNYRANLRNDIAEVFDSILESEIQATEVPTEILSWCSIGFEVIEICRANRADFQFSYLDIACINISDIISDMACKFAEGQQLNKVTEIFETIQQLINYKVEADYFLFTLCDVMIDHITDKHNLDGLEEENQKVSKEDTKRSAQWIGWMEQLQTQDENQVSEIKALKEKFTQVENLIITKPENLKTRSSEPDNPDQPSVFTIIDEKQLNYQTTAAFASTRGTVNVGIHRGTYKDQKIVVKIYSFNGNSQSDSIEKINKEIQIYQKLSDCCQVNPQLCFIKMHGVVNKNNQVKIVLDQYDYNLMDYINNLKTQNYEFEDLQFNFIAYKLVFSFNYMKQLGILHQDIKPHNMLVDQHWNVKIIDFDVSYVKIQDATLSSTGYFPIQGTEGYFSPEIAKIRSGNQPKHFNPEKSDVYSLGLVLYQLLTYNPVLGVRNSRIKKGIANISFLRNETKNYLLLMLEKNPKKRLTFAEVLPLIPYDPATGLAKQ